MAIKLSVEASEIMAAVAMTMTATELSTYSKNAKGLADFLKKGLKIAKSSTILYGSENAKQEFLKAFDPTETTFLNEAAKGISAALSIKEWLLSINDRGVKVKTPEAKNVFMTGDTWPKEVQKFQVKAYGFSAYNSSDIIFKVGKGYYGVSLKKKETEKAADPTIINKAFDTVLQGSEFNKVKSEVTNIRIKYFARVIKEAFKRGPLTLKGSLNIPDDVLFKTKIKDKFIIDLKGYGTVNLKSPNDSSKTLFTDDIVKDPKKSMRTFVNMKLASSDTVYIELMKIMNKYSEIFAKSLLNLVLKINLYNELKDNSFAFALITAIAKLDKDNNPTIVVDKAKPLHTILCGLSALNKGNKPYLLILDKAKNEKSDAAKIYLILKKGNVNVLDMELRYKGGFTSQPQFFATISKDFTTLLKDKCIVPQ